MGRLIAFLLDGLALYFVVKTVLGLFSGARSTRRPQAAPPRAPERSGGTLVRDPHCGTYIPESRAIRVGSGDTTQYFCSTKCRDAYRGRT